MDAESQGAISEYTFKNVVQNHVIQVIFARMATVSFDSAGGSEVASQIVEVGNVATEPDMPVREGHKFLGWYLNDDLYDFATAVDEDIELIAKWEANSSDELEFTISASTSEGGTITPFGEVVVRDSCSQKFVFTPDEGYVVADVLVDGESVDAVSSYTFENVTNDHRIEVRFSKDESVKVQSVILSKTTATMKKGSVLQLTAQVLPENADDKTLRWTSSDTAIAVVTNGIVAAIEVGEVMITAESQDGSSISANCILNVMEEVDDDFTGDAEDDSNADANETINGGSGNNISGTTTGEDTNKNPNTNNNGGTNQNNTATGNNQTGTGQNTGSIIVNDVRVTSLSIIVPSKKLAAGKKVKLSVKVTPSNATNSAVTWQTSNTKYATIDQNGKLTLKKAGIGKSVTVTATATDGSGVKATYKIKIMKHAVKSIKISAASKSVTAGKSIKLKTTIKTTGKSVNKTLKWTSSNTKYATVTKSGKVKTKKAGKGKTVKITAQATDGTGKKASIKIKLK